MTKASKIQDRLLSKPSDFTWNELTTLMAHLGYELKATGGSSRKFIHTQTRAVHMVHEPHPAPTLKMYQIRNVIRFLRAEKQI